MNRPVESVLTYGRYLQAFAIHPDGTHYAASGSSSLRVASRESLPDFLWELNQGKRRVLALRFSADGEYLAARFSSPSQWKIFETHSGKELLRWECAEMEAFISWSDIPDVLARFDRSGRAVESVNVRTGMMIGSVEVASRRI